MPDHHAEQIAEFVPVLAPDTPSSAPRPSTPGHPIGGPGRQVRDAALHRGRNRPSQELSGNTRVARVFGGYPRRNCAAIPRSVSAGIRLTHARPGPRACRFSRTGSENGHMGPPGTSASATGAAPLRFLRNRSPRRTRSGRTGPSDTGFGQSIRAPRSAPCSPRPRSRAKRAEASATKGRSRSIPVTARSGPRETAAPGIGPGPQPASGQIRGRRQVG